MVPHRLGVWALVLLTGLWAAITAAENAQEGVDEVCKPCHFTQGSSAFGIWVGGNAGPLKLRSMDLLLVETDAALPLANPVFTPLELTEQLTASSSGSAGSNGTGRLAAVDAIAHPTLVATEDGRLLMFYAAHACGRDRWGIAASQAADSSGTSWRGLGMVLEDAGTDLQAPSLFQHNGSWYLVPEMQGQQEVRVYKATTFPTSWEAAGVLLKQPVAGVSVVQHDKRWWLIGHQPGAGQGGQDSVLSVFEAQSPLGPWSRHLDTTFAVQVATTLGSAFVWQGAIHHLARTCRRGACSPPQLMQLDISAGKVEQRAVQLDLGCQLWRQRAAWDSAGWSHLAAAQAPDGNWLAVLEASQLPPSKPALPQQLQFAVAVFRALALLCIVVLLLNAAARLPSVRSLLLKQRWTTLLLSGARTHTSSHKQSKEETPVLPAYQEAAVVVQLIGSNSFNFQTKAASPAGARLRNGSSLQHLNSNSYAGSPASSRAAARSSNGLRKWVPPCRLLLVALLLAAALLGIAAVGGVQQVAKPFFVQPQGLPVEGQWSRFTLMVMSYDARLQQLQWYVRHYSQCPSVGEILVVWNRGAPPDPRTAFQSDVPVRVRVEAVNSMNNRFRPDDRIKFRSVLSLDDDILMPCTTIEATFARWRRNPRQLTGYYPRLLLPAGGAGSPGPPVYHFEDFVFQQGAYNVILAGAAFMDSATFFPLYSSAATAPARALVDEVFNCDDLLLNFVVANYTAAQVGRTAASGSQDAAAAEVPPAVQLVRPERRIDVSRLSGVGISHNPARFKAAADRCLAEFTRLFGGCPLQLRKIEPHYGRPPRCNLWHLDCMYL